MALNQENQLLDITGEFIYRRLREQPWYKANANTVTTVGGFVATVVAWAASQPFAASPGVQVGILIVGFLLTVFGVKQTKNGFSASQVAAINDERARVISELQLADTTVEDSAGGEDLDSMVAEFNANRGD